MGNAGTAPQPSARFSERVHDYLRYRPHYPPEMVPAVAAATGLTSAWVVADIGSGTGFSAEPFLRNGNPVVGIEPNGDMRKAGDFYLADYASFSSQQATAEATGLADRSVDAVCVGQALHWFDIAQARAEWARILRGRRAVLVMWNRRRNAASRFMGEYEDFLRSYGTDYRDVSRTVSDKARLAALFDDGRFVVRRLDNEQRLQGYDDVLGRVLSASYMPKPGMAGHTEMKAQLRALYDRHATEGHITFVYDTWLYMGTVGATGVANWLALDEQNSNDT